ncbi:MAG: VOC family protein [Gammaproteobacteria bacterium]|jgi:catechol 2,3-dioxygenase-like lactoylglutathione lyase family enzyme
MNASTDFGIGGWREALLSVADLESWKKQYLQTGDWEVRCQGDVDGDYLLYLKIKAQSAKQAVLAHKGANYGHVRLICFEGASRQPLIRSNGRPWETGGWFDLNARVENMEEQFLRLQDSGWSGLSDPIEWTFGTTTVKEWLAYGPDGIVWAIIERINPPLNPAARPGPFGPHFNSTQIVGDISEARAFYEGLLGFTQLVNVADEPVATQPRQNVLGLPEELATQQRWNITMLQAPEAGGGSIELLSLPGLSGRNFAPLADPPNRGILSLRFPVGDLHRLRTHLAAAGVRFAREPQTVTLPPDGRVTMMTVYGPGRARLDFYQPE